MNKGYILSRCGEVFAVRLQIARQELVASYEEALLS